MNHASSRTWPGACTAGILVLAYMLLWWNRFTGLSDAVFLMHGQQVLAGHLPYRDYYLPIPPLAVLKTALVTKLFGSEILAPRLVGVIERTGLTVALFWWLASLFQKQIALLATVVSMIVFCGDYADPLASYHHDSVYLAVSAGLCAGWLARTSGAKKALAALLCGLFCGLALLTTQTTGVGITLTLFVLILLCSAGRPALPATAALFAAGWMLPVAAVGRWLFENGALSSAVQILFGKGTSSKGPLWSVLSRPLVFPIVEGVYREPCVAATLLLVAAWMLVRRWRYAKPLALICAVGAGYEMSRHFFADIEPLATYLGLFGSAGISAYYFLAWLRGPLDETQKQNWILGGTSFAISYMLSLSWAAYQPLAIPSLAFVICFTWSRVGPLVRRGIMIGATGLAAVAFLLKVSQPYGWVSWMEPPIWTATHISRLPELRGMRLSPIAISTAEQATEAIQSACAADGRFFAYPYLPLLYVLSHRPPATFSYLPWFDVTPDYVAESDAKQLIADPPCAIAYLELSKETIETNERLFRNKADSGQRRLVSAITSLIGTYKIRFDRNLPGGTRLTIYARGSQ